MVFLGGPRQVGKTTLAQSLIQNYRDKHPAYINWDSDLDRRRLRDCEWPKSEPLIVLDEIHKMKVWGLTSHSSVGITPFDYTHLVSSSSVEVKRTCVIF